MELLPYLCSSQSQGGKSLGCAEKYSAHVTNMVEAWQIVNNVEVGMDYSSYCKNIILNTCGGGGYQSGTLSGQKDIKEEKNEKQEEEKVATGDDYDTYRYVRVKKKRGEVTKR